MINKNKFNGLLLLAVILSFGIIIEGCSDSGTSGSDVTGITDFRIQEYQNFEFSIDQNSMEIINDKDSLPYGTDPSELIAEFETIPKTTVTVGEEEQIS